MTYFTRMRKDDMAQADIGSAGKQLPQQAGQGFKPQKKKKFQRLDPMDQVRGPNEMGDHALGH